MKTTRIGIALFVVFLIAIAMVSQTLIRQEKVSKKEDILNKGNYLVSLIALHRMNDFEGDKQNFFLKTLTEATSYKDFAYCFIHDQTGNAVVSLVPADLSNKIPKEIRVKALYTMGLIRQDFPTGGSENKIYEFAKPIFENGEKAGTVRLGLKLPAVSLFASDRLRLLGIISFLTLAAGLFAYYGITLTLRPLKDIGQNYGATCEGSPEFAGNLLQGGGIGHIIKELERSLNQLKGRMDKSETEKVELASKLGVINYEKNQVMHILDAVDFGIIITDIHDRSTYVNKYMLGLLKQERPDLLDRPIGEVLEGHDILSFISRQGSGSHGSNRRHMETGFPALAPGETYQVALSHLEDEEGTITGKLILIRNITSEKRAQNAKHEFIAHVAHELKTPLTTIKSYNEMLRDGEVDDTEMQKQFFNTINEESDRLTRLINNLLTSSKIEMGGLTIDKGLVKTDWLANDAIAAVETTAQSKQIHLEKHLPDKWPSLVGDKELLKVAIINILGNAVKYTPESGKVTFSLIDQESSVVFEIADTGYGVSKEDLPRIFEKAYRSQDPNIAKQSGSGFGLAIALDIVQLHDGDIEAESAPGQGTRFTVKLPKEEYYLGKQ
jgi:two-component system sensor histidine kinase VicK